MAATAGTRSSLDTSAAAQPHPSAHGRDKSTVKRPWHRCLLCCLAGAQTPQDIQDPFDEQQQSHSTNPASTTDGRRVAVAAAAAPAGPPATAEQAGPAVAAARRTAAVPEEAAGPPVVLRSVGATRQLLDDDNDELIPAAAMHMQLAGLVAEPGAAAPVSAAAVAAAPGKLPLQQQFGHASDTVQARDTAAGMTMQQHQQQQQQAVPPGGSTPGAQSPASGGRTPRSPFKSSPFSVRQHQELVAEELRQQKLRKAARALEQQQQHVHGQHSSEAAAAAAESPHSVHLGERRPSTSDQANVQNGGSSARHSSSSAMELSGSVAAAGQLGSSGSAGGQGPVAAAKAAALVDINDFTAPPGLKVKTGAQNKAAFMDAAAAPAVAAAHIQQQQQQQQPWAEERLPSLEHWSSDFGLAPAAAGSGSVSMPANVQLASSAARQQQQKLGAGQPPFKSRQLPSGADAADGLAGLPLPNQGSSSSAGGNSINPFMSAGGFSSIGSGSEGLLWGSGSISNYQTAPHTSTGLVCMQASGVGSDLLLQQQVGDGGSSNGCTFGATSGVASHSIAASAPNNSLLSAGSSSSPFERLQTKQHNQRSQQHRGAAASRAEAVDDGDETWDVVPMVLSPLRIPSFQQRPAVATDHATSPTPPSPKASVTGVSNSVINMMLSEDGIPLVPTNNSDSDESPGGGKRCSRSSIQDLFAGTPRASHGSTSFSTTSSSFRARQHAAAVAGTPRATSFSGSHAAAAAAFGGSAHSRMGLTSAGHSSSNSSGGYSGLQPPRPLPRRSSGSGSYAYARSAPQGALGRGGLLRPVSASNLTGHKVSSLQPSSSDEDEGDDVTCGGGARNGAAAAAAAPGGSMYSVISNSALREAAGKLDAAKAALSSMSSAAVSGAAGNSSSDLLADVSGGDSSVLNTAGDNVVSGGALFSRSGWASLRKQPDSSTADTKAAAAAAVREPAGMD